ncbi:toprim domain-containing protein [Bacillus wiedmannii]|uniref:toprim domain-containing protein n=1 Tax=Bacillus wiedmannii TaxID=1890302 RepID=UPI000BF0A3D6|nr:toprim domain-containing protein [Bacillus wiedmannii]PEM08517.1 DNA primase [Bacillus wiedmannii]
MAAITIKGHKFEIDVQEEIEKYEWRNGRYKGHEFVACSPFRDEINPSFSINLETGLWIDFGSSDDEMKKGNIVKLIAFFEDLMYEEAEDLLLEGYNVGYVESDELELDFSLDMDEYKTFGREELKPYLFYHKAYLMKRGISEEIAKRFIVGYDPKTNAMAFLWRDFKGKVINVKFRTIQGKKFFYLDGGQQIKNHLFGLYDVHKEGTKTAYIVESEIDALYLWSHGFPAAAIGSSHMSDVQRRLILQSNIETLVIATDNDAAGERLRRQIKRELGGYMELKDLKLPNYVKDVNDLPPAALRTACSSLKDIGLMIL